MKKILVLFVLLAMPLVASAQGLVGDCYDCHTMHNSEEGQAAVVLGDGTTSGTPIPNLLRFDCIACHANDPDGGSKIYTGASNDSVIPQVAHGDDFANSLAGGNFSYVEDGFLGVGSSRKGHNVNDLFGPNGAIAFQEDNNEGAQNEPPGLVHSSDRGAFTVATNFDMFTCAGARGCHGTRDQLIGDITFTQNGDGNFAAGSVDFRVGLAAISGAHHDSYDGVKDALNPANSAEAVHVGGSTAAAFGDSGYGVVDGYRFIPGLKGYGNQTNRWENNDADHNEYYGVTTGFDPTDQGCQVCHIEGNEGNANQDVTDLDGEELLGTRMALDSTIITPNNTMSGFCSSCHGTFHSSGSGLDYEAGGIDNGVSGAFLRHPSDYLIPDYGEYAAYTTYTASAPVARPDITGYTLGGDTNVTPDVDMVMCLSCHVAHASDQDFMLRFDYGVMTAGEYADIGTAQGIGGCLACHTEKGVLPEDR